MKKSQILVATLCASALVLSACTFGPRKSKKKKSSSQDVPTSVVPGPTSSGTPTSSSGTPAPTSSSGTPTPTSSSGAPAPVVSSIAVTTAPTKTVYTAGESFDPAGMVVTATYSDGSTAIVTSQCQFSPSVLTENTAFVTITFGGQSTTQAVTVNAPLPTSWSSEQLQMLNYYLENQGSEIPFKYVEGAELFRDTENAMLTYGDGTDTCSEDFIKEYVSLFSADWNIEVNQLALAFADSLVYEGSKTFNEGESNEVTVYVSFYGLGDDGYITNDGTGHFGLDIYDDFYYSWDEFAAEYQAVLDHVYDTTDEEGEEVPFPDAIPFEGDTPFIEVGDYLDTKGYYIAFLYGVSEADYLEYIEAYYDSDKWTGYTDTLQGLEAYYHESEKVSVGYIYQAEISRLVLVIYPYEKIYRAWSEVEPVIDAYIDTVNPETTIQVPAFEADSYVIEDHADKGYNGVFAFGTDEAPITQEMVDSYVAAFDPTVWTVEVMTDVEEEPLNDDEGNLIWFNTEAEAEAYIVEHSLENAHVESDEDDDGVYYYIVVATETSFYLASAKDYSMNLQIAYNTMSDGGGYAAVIVIPRAPLTTTFPSEQIVSLFSASLINVENLPSYTTSEGKFLVDADEKEVGIEVFGSNSEEAAAYVTALTSNGWVVDEEASDASKNLTVLMYGTTLARCQVADYSEEAGVHEIVIVFDVKVVDWSDEMKAQFETTLHGLIPPYFGFDVNYSSQSDYFYSYISSSDIETVAAMVEKAFEGAEGWEYDEETGAYVAEAADGKGYAQVYFNDSYVSSHGIYIFVIEFVWTTWSDAEISAFETALHGIVPEYIRGGLYSPVTAGHNFEGNGLFTDEQLADVEKAFKEAGWTITGTGHEAIYTKNAADGTGYAQVSWEAYNGKYFFFIDWVEGTPVPPTPVESSVKYTFTNKNSGTEVTDLATIFGWFSDPETDIFTAATASSKVYPGANGGSGTSAWNVQNALKIGSSTAGGSLTLSVAEGVSIEKIVIEGYGWKNSSSKALVITVGGQASASDPLPYTTTISGGGEAGTVEFTFDTPVTGSIVISTGDTAVIITSITVYYSVAN